MESLGRSVRDGHPMVSLMGEALRLLRVSRTRRVYAVSQLASSESDVATMSGEPEALAVARDDDAVKRPRFRSGLNASDTNRTSNLDSRFHHFHLLASYSTLLSERALGGPEVTGQAEHQIFTPFPQSVRTGTRNSMPCSILAMNGSCPETL